MHVGRQLITEHEGLTVEALAARSDLSHPEQAWVPTGGMRAARQRLGDIRQAVRDLARRQGYPALAGPRERTAFDRSCAGELLRLMNIVPADAASDGVWTFLTCLVLPDVSAWRFPDRHEERFLGSPRNTLRRLWWRAYVLDGTRSDSDGTSVVEALGEDEVVQVMERPSLAGNPRLARRVCLAFLEGAAKTPALGRMELMRDAAKRLIRLTPFVALDGLGTKALDDILSAVFAESARMLQAN
jgi:hypothetical protein